MKKRLITFLCLALVLLPAFRGAPAAAASNDAADFPACYDLRELGLVTEVKDQGLYGTCWAFCVANAMESNALVQGYGEYDLSEYQIAYLFSHIFPEEGSLADGEGTACIGDAWHDGIYGAIVSSSLMRGYAIQSEEAYPYSNMEESLPPEGASMDGALYIDSCYTVPVTDTEAVKTLLMTNGALYTNVCSTCWQDPAYFNPETGAAYLPTYFGKYSTISHFVSIVGWDDNYSKDNFGTTPPGDGAWIIKNSWGTDYGDNGYLYLSYYDAAINYRNCATSVTVTNQRSYDRIYQYDGGAGLQPVGRVTGVAMNFTAAENESITAVRIKPIGNISYSSFFCSDWAFDRTVAKISVYKGTFDEKTVDADPIYEQEYEIVYPDYQTVAFDTEVPLKKGSHYYIKISFDRPVYYAVDQPDQKMFYSYQNVVRANPGETYVAVETNGGAGTWQDTVTVLGGNRPGSACIKVLTKDRENDRGQTRFWIWIVLAGALLVYILLRSKTHGIIHTGMDDR
ncbi:MAG: hypothetical protein IJH91_00455 [Mogibacterium sp.]|nr:hypothetical protein [Mogibacterium sp.]